jgi:hypothetical protein
MATKRTTKAPAKGKTTRKSTTKTTTRSTTKSTTKAPKSPKTRKAPAQKATHPVETFIPQPLPIPSSADSEVRTKFTLYNLLGEERAYYLVDRFDVERPEPRSAEQAIAHSIVIIDRSGSMEPHIGELKETLIKLLTLDEYSQLDMLVTLISYAGSGDLAVHFERQPIQDIMRRDSEAIQEIKRIEVADYTCISQALDLASKFVNEDEMTAVTLHSDGYANHPDPNVEAKSLVNVCTQLQEQPVFVNTIAYTDFSDFRLLSRVANSLSGNCLKTGNIRQIYDALYSTSKLLSSTLTPPLDIPPEEDYDYQVFISHGGGKINGTAGILRIRGLQEDHDAVVYRYKRLTEREYRSLRDVPEQQTCEAVLAFAHANLAEGNLNTAKYALASTFDATLLDRHARALTNVQVAALAQDLETVLFQPTVLQEHEVLDHVPVNNRIPVLQLARLLGGHSEGYEINLPYLREHYVHRGVRRIKGTRDDDGKLMPPTLKPHYTDNGEWARVSLYEINRNTATLNMLIARPVNLVPAEGGDRIREVAGIPLNELTLFKHYTLVGDGELNLPTLKIRISNRELFDRLVAEGILFEDDEPATKFDPEAAYLLRLDLLPIVPPFEGTVDLDGVFDDLARTRVLSSILAAHLREESDQYSREQVDALRQHYLSKNLYLNFPTTNPYTDLQEALATGTVDTRTSYKIDIGSKEILNLSKLHPANKFLDRMYELHAADGEKIAKPTFADLLEEGVTIRPKRLSSRTRITAVDEFMKPIFDDFLGIAETGAATAVLERVGATNIAGGRKGSKTAWVAALTRAKKLLDAHTDEVFAAKVSPLVFYIGATGVLPDEIEAKALSAEQLIEKYPDLTLSREEQDGTFFEIGDTILSVYAEIEYFSR